MEYNCKQCNEKFSSNEKNRKFCNMNCYNKSKFGEGNPFFGKSHSKETIEKAKEKIREKLRGEKNPFFGKSHSKETLDKIRLKLQEYRNNNKDIILAKKLAYLDLSKEKLELCFYEYKNTTETLMSLEKKYNVDKRVLQKYFIILEICSKNELEEVAIKKKFKNSQSHSENEFYKLLIENFKGHNIKKQYNIPKTKYYYDFIIDDILLIEYDGYYWHQEIENKNDLIKNNLAQSSGFILYRVKEDKKRTIDVGFELKKIRDILNEIQIEKNQQSRKN